ncbi:MAG: hypothetical protein DRO01_02685 [Thermoproteota archaeon]|nr:MAG: hypothetical protein DRO01_02685 [Candidatus Korarchaeota archaeon]
MGVYPEKSIIFMTDEDGRISVAPRHLRPAPLKGEFYDEDGAEWAQCAIRDAIEHGADQLGESETLSCFLARLDEETREAILSSPAWATPVVEDEGRALPDWSSYDLRMIFAIPLAAFRRLLPDYLLTKTDTAMGCTGDFAVDLVLAVFGGGYLEIKQLQKHTEAVSARFDERIGDLLAEAADRCEDCGSRPTVSLIDYFVCEQFLALLHEYAEDNANEEIVRAVDEIEISYHDGISVSFNGAPGAEEIDPAVHPLAALILLADAAREGGE